MTPARNSRWRALLLAAILALAFGTLRVYRRDVRVQAARVVRRDLVQTVLASGRVVMAGDVELRVKGAGVVKTVQVREGEHVAAGQTLITLDDADARSALAEAQATVMRSLAELRAIRGKAQPLAQTALRRAEVDVQYAQEELSRTSQLFAAGAMGAQSLSQARAALELAQTRRDTAQLELTSTLPQGTDRELAASSLRQAQAALERAHVRLADAVATSSSAGTVIDLAVEAGDSVQPGQLLLRMVGDGPVQLELEPDERNLALLQVGQLASASAEAYPQQAFDARLSYIAKVVDPTRGTIRVRLDVPKPPDYLRADMTVSVEIMVARVPGALVVPALAVHELARNDPWVLVAEDGRAVRHAVALGRKDESSVQVTSGVSEGEVVLLDPELPAGARVRPLFKER